MQAEHSHDSGLSPPDAYVDMCGSAEKLNVDYATAEGEQFNSCESYNSEQNDKMFLSTETLIDNADKLDLDTRLNQPERYRNLSGSSPNFTTSHSDTSTYLSAKVTSGLLMSPTSLSQEVHVTVGEDKQRMSAVLDSLDLHLVYLPTTQQLVAANTVKDGESEAGCNIPDKQKSENCDQNSDSVYLNSNSSNFLSPSVQISEPPDHSTKMETSSIKHIHIRTPSNDDVLSISESDCSMHTAEPNDDLCDNSNFLSNFPRINTNDSLLRTFTDASSLSSLSTGTDFSVSAASLDDGEGTGHCIDTGDGGFIEISLNSKNSFEKGKNPSEDSGFEDRNVKPKRKGLSSLLSRGLFSRKQKYSVTEEEQPGWKLFGKVPPREPSSKPHSPSPSENEGEEPSSSQTKRNDVEIASTTALILQNRPSNLPCKSPEEQERHQRQYEAMVEAARKREQKKLKQKKRLMQQQLKQEEQLLAAAKVWNTDIIPNWETMKHSKKARELWWHGIPTNVRGKVWRMALGNDLNVTSELYEICVSRAADKIRKMDESPVIFGKQEGPEEPPSSNRESSVELIKLDISRTFPQLCIFQKGGPYHDLLHSLLGAYACYRPDIGYVQGMSFIAAVLLLNMDVADAFICFANLLNQPCQLAFFRVDKEMMNVYIETYEEFFRENMPTLQSHFQHNSLTPDLYLYDWIFTIYSKSLPLDVACRVWDIFCRDGEEFLFRTALGILKYFEDILMQMDFIHLAQFLTKLPDKDPYDGLFQSIECIQMIIDKKRFLNVLTMKKDNKEKDVT